MLVTLDELAQVLVASHSVHAKEVIPEGKCNEMCGSRGQLFGFAGHPAKPRGELFLSYYEGS